MAKNVIINGVTYQSVPYVDIPKSDGSGDTTFFDTTSADMGANDLRKGKTGFGPNGSVAGNLDTITAATTDITAKAQEVTIAAGIHSGAGKVRIATAEQAKLVSGNIRAGVTILGIEGGLSSVTVTQDQSTKALKIS